jgi:tetratricopeptide (TPR) repeat protein
MLEHDASRMPRHEAPRNLFLAAPTNAHRSRHTVETAQRLRSQHHRNLSRLTSYSRQFRADRGAIDVLFPGTQLASLSAMHGLLQRIANGQHTAVLGPTPELDSSAPMHLIRIRCDRADHPLGPLVDAKALIERLLELTPDSDEPHPAAVPRARWRPLGEVSESWDARLVGLFNRLRDRCERPTGLLLEAVERADHATLELLERFVTRPNWLRLPLVLEFRTLPVSSAAARLLEALKSVEGNDGVLEFGRHSEERLDSEEPRDDIRRSTLGELPADVRHVLRAASVLGPRFSVESVAELLSTNPLEVLYLLQAARDAGVPLQDGGDGSFHLPAGTAKAFAAELLPSLARAWHQRAAELTASKPTNRAGSENAPAARAPAPVTGVAGSRPSRAAAHAEAAGDPELAAQQYALAARHAVTLGAYAKALACDFKALELLSALPMTDRRRLARADVLLDLGRTSFTGIGPGSNFSLSEAMRWLDACRALLLPTDPVELRAEVAATIAAVCYDIGEPSALNRALGELADASAALLAGAHPLEAARLWNDEAAVRVRLGELERAEHLLRRSRELFSKLLPTDARAAVELAETDHLQARLVLHAPLGAVTADAPERALERARDAERSYASLGLRQERARVWETLGRLERLAGNHENAAEHLAAAVQYQQASGDAIGLARSTAALSELAADEGDWRGALDLLADSIQLNLSKGSLLGLSVNRDALDALRPVLASADDPALLEQARELQLSLDGPTGVSPSARRRPSMTEELRVSHRGPDFASAETRT